MKTTRKLIGAVFACALAAALSSSAQTPTATDGRLLASNCFQCHATDGRGGFDSLAGKSASEIYSELKEMQREQPGSGDYNIMVPHAKGYSDAQLRKIAAYFAQIR